MPKLYHLMIKDIPALCLSEDDKNLPMTLPDCRKAIKGIMRDLSCILPIPVREYRLVPGLSTGRLIQVCIIDNRSFMPSWVTIGTLIPG